MSKKKKSPGKSESGPAKDVESPDTAGLLESIRQRLLPTSAALLSTLFVWAFLAPADATSVFMGEALAHNLFWLLSGLLVSLGMIGRAGFHFSRGAWVLSGLAILWLLWSTFAAGEYCSPRRAWFGCWQVISIACCYFVCRGILVGPKTKSALAMILLLGCTACALHGVYQVTVEFPAQKTKYFEDPDAFIAAIPGLVAPEGSPQRARFENRLFSPEPYATFALANSLACVLSAALVLLAAALWSTWQNRIQLAEKVSKFRARQIVLGLIAVVVALCWFLTLSRTAYLAVAAGFSVLLFLYLRLRSHNRAFSRGSVLAAGAVVFVLLLACVGWLWQNDKLVLSEAKKSLGYRIEYWQATTAMLQDHGFRGVGLGNFQAYYPQYKLPEASEEIADPHNWPLDLAATLGIPMFCIVLAWLGFHFRGAFPLLAAVPLTGDEQNKATNHDLLDQQLGRMLFWGAAGGGLICLLLLGLLSAYAVGTYLCIWVLAGVLLWFVGPLLNAMLAEDSSATKVIYLAGWVAIAVCLLASGSWQASGIAFPFVALLALQSPSVGRAGRRAEAEAESQVVVPWIAVLPALGLVLFVLQMWQPVTSAWTLSQQAMDASSNREQIQKLESAIAADSSDAEHKSRLAQVSVAQALTLGRGEFSRAAEQGLDALEQWLAQDQRSFAHWRLACHLAMDLAAQARFFGLQQEQAYLARARGFANRAVECYPTSVELHVQLAAIAALEMDKEVVETELARAIALSENTPHQDKQLGRHRTIEPGDQQIHFPFVFPALQSAATSNGKVQAEPLIEWMRSRIGTEKAL